MYQNIIDKIKFVTHLQKNIKKKQIFFDKNTIKDAMRFIIVQQKKPIRTYVCCKIRFSRVIFREFGGKHN